MTFEEKFTSAMSFLPVEQKKTKGKKLHAKNEERCPEKREVLSKKKRQF